MNRLFRVLAVVGLWVGTTAAYADGEVAAAAHSGGWVMQLVMFGGLFVMMYLLIIRPQGKKAQDHRNLLARLTKGDEVITQGGIVGVINRETGNFIFLAIGDGVEMAVQRQAVVQLLPKGTLKSL